MTAGPIAEVLVSVVVWLFLRQLLLVILVLLLGMRKLPGQIFHHFLSKPPILLLLFIGLYIKLSTTDILVQRVHSYSRALGACSIRLLHNDVTIRFLQGPISRNQSSRFIDLCYVEIF